MSIKIHKLTTKVPIKIGPITFFVVPFSYKQKMEILGQTKTKAGIEVQDLPAMAYLSIKYCLKDIKGVVDEQGKPYKLSFDEDGLEEDCLSEIMNLVETQKLITVAANLLNGFEDPKVPGVKWNVKESQTKKK